MPGAMTVDRTALEEDVRGSYRARLARAAALGLLLSSCQNAGKAESTTTAASATGEGAVTAASAAKDCCMGKNDCKGKGGCAVAESHSCMGKNDCKGKGGCDMHCPK